MGGSNEVGWAESTKQPRDSIGVRRQVGSGIISALVKG